MLQVAPILTDQGESLQIRALSGEQIIFTKMKIGSGVKPAGETGKTFTDLIHPELSFSINSIEVSNNYAVMSGQFDTTMILHDFTWTEFGLFCAGSLYETFSGDGETTTFVLTDKPDAVAIVKVNGDVATVSAYDKTTGTVTLATAPDEGVDNVVVSYPDSIEQLYGYSYDTGAGTLRAGLTDSLATQVVQTIVAIGDATSVTAILSDAGMYARKTDFDDHVNNLSNPHHVSASQIGVDAEYLNTYTNDLAATYTVASALSALVSGELFSVAFGKIAKAVSELLSHISNRANPHGVTASQINAAPATHTHSADSLTGVLPVAKGGTGNSTVDVEPTQNSTKMVTSDGVYRAVNDVVNSEAMNARFNEKANTSHTHGMNDINGVLPVSKGGTGNSSVDTTPTSGSTKMVTSGGIFTSLQSKLDTSALGNGNAGSATKLETARKLKVDLASTADQTFDGSADKEIGVKGTLAVANGGTGATDAATARTNLGAAASSHTHDASNINAGVLPVARGGTGSSTLYGSDLAKVRTATLTSSGWSSSAPYTQDVTVNGITANDAPVISAGAPATMNAANYSALIKNFAMIDRAVTGANKITFYCYRKKPTANIPLYIKGV